MSPMKRGNPSGKGHTNIWQSFGDATLSFVSIKVQIFYYLGHILSVLCSNFAAEIKNERAKL